MNIGIIGLGLMGASLGKAILKKTGHTVYGYDISEETLLKAGLVGAINYPLADIGCDKLDLMLIAVNPRDFKSAFLAAAHYLKKDGTVADICGNKSQIVADMKALSAEFRELVFIAMHPMAGREFSGVLHSTPTLFERSSALIVPVTMDIAAMQTLKTLLTDIGFGEVLPTTERVHDEIIAYTSQLAHIVSSCYVQSPTAIRHDGFSAGSFRDLTRVARMNPRMWTELIADNRDNVLAELDRFIADMSGFRDALRAGDETALNSFFSEGNEKKTLIEKNTRERRKSNS
ncbi:MAG: prephenate dehydrogenase/arogenate dehydrogenase family protein [Clostridiales bacterium]|nr:prephenate dehydrogenase/arogenate dehydrogenase family protein [Clostridiales bacterium]